MDQTIVSLIRDLGSAGILALTLVLIVRAIYPLIASLTEAHKEQAAARREQTEASKAVLKRWEESDTILERNSTEHVKALRAVTEELKNLSAIDTQRIQQNTVTAANIAGARDDIRNLKQAFSTGKNEVMDAMTEKFEQNNRALQEALTALKEVRTKVDDVMALLQGKADVPEPQEKPAKDEEESS